MLNYLFIGFIATLAIQLFYYLYIFRFFPKNTTKLNTNKHSSGVSVIIYVKNNAKDLKANLPAVLNQSYPDFEIVLINDYSSDKSLNVIQEFAKKNANIKVVNVKPVEAFWGNKKYALTLGIKTAKHECLLLTKASCKPSSKYWIQEMANQFSNSKSIVLGYGTYIKNKKSTLNKFLRFEALYTALQFISYAKFGHPFMGDGCNLAYKKTTFFKTNGFINHIDLKEGDDDLFINQSANRANTAISISKHSIVSLPQDTTFTNWFNRKRKQLSTLKRYKAKHKLLLAAYYYTKFIFWLLAIILLISTHLWLWVLGLITLKIVLTYLTIGKIMNRVKEKDLILGIPIFELALVSLQLTIFMKNWISKP